MRLTDYLTLVNDQMVAAGKIKLCQFGDPRWCDWHVTLTRPMLTWWSKYPRVESGQVMVPAEVGEVLCQIGASSLRIIGSSRQSTSWSLPWEHIDD